MELIATTGEWGLNLQTGFCGFITRQGSLVDDGIEYFEKFEAGIPFVHTFILEQPGYIIEALGSGVVKQPLSKYVGDARVQCFIRAPRFWTPAKGLQYAREADRHIGEKYGYGLIVADALANTVLGRLLNKWTGGVPDSAMTWLPAMKSGLPRAMNNSRRLSGMPRRDMASHCDSVSQRT